ncbi:N-acetyltransferase [Chitinophaga lutea]|uniref:N-acetyltransferase n=1 Tax=Chitinophaga lutea TaxID=2488634 RepID=A0A3N4PN23_9BACT|nr:GNAT family N-acetyltransferase [Chitinophaga lutea]RPE05717.1 N-acetyltransferase [Chitinophaga lutea]
MDISIRRAAPDDIRAFRTLFLHELNRQFICNKCHDYGWADSYLFTVAGEPAGYGAVWGTDRREDRDTIFEFYLLPPYRRLVHEIFLAFRAQCGAVYVEAQSNDALLSLMLFSHTANIRAEAILFEDDVTTGLQQPDVTFREVTSADESAGDNEYLLEQEGRIVATGGLMLNYNYPYADIYMDVKEPFRGNGYGSYIVQELKREAYARQRVPAARCNISNRISQRTLERAGLKICGYRLKGDAV